MDYCLGTKIIFDSYRQIEVFRQSFNGLKRNGYSADNCESDPKICQQFDSSSRMEFEFF